MNTNERKLVVFVLVLCSGPVLATGCTTTPCERSGCEALTSPAADTGKSAIGGVAASETDVIEYGCPSCGLGTVTLGLWKTVSPVTDAASAQAAVANSPATMNITAERRYEQALDAGEYLVCATRKCVLVQVIRDHLSPVNVKIAFSTTIFTVFDPLSRTKTSAKEFDVERRVDSR